jgi:toxin ParE1/3/4
VQLKWAPDAERDLDLVHQYIGRDNPAAATRTVLRIVRQVALLVEHPGIGRPGRVAGTRELVIPGLPYVVAYIHRGDIVAVLRIVHGAMKWPKSF